MWVFFFLIQSKGKFWYKISRFDEIFTFYTPAPVVSVLADRHIMQRSGMRSYSAKKSVALKIVYNKKKIQFFGMNVPFISSEAKNTYLMSDFANKWHIHSKNLNILYVFVPFNLFQ